MILRRGRGRGSTTRDLEQDTAKLADVLEVLREHEVFCWLDQGTLLGLIRDGQLIPWDVDIDLSVWHHDLRRIEDLFPKLEELGFFCELHEYKSCIFLSRGKGWPIEIAGYEAVGDAFRRFNAVPRRRRSELVAKRAVRLLPTPVYTRLRRAARDRLRMPTIEFRTPTRFFESFSTIDLPDIGTAHIPALTEEYLEFKYGPDWRSPRTEWDYSKDDGGLWP